MKRRVIVAILCTVVLLGWARVEADETNSPPQAVRLEVDLSDGSHVIGVPNLESVPLQTSYAKIDIDVRQIDTIVIAEDHETASLGLANGDQLKGVITLGPIELTTVFGSVKIGIQHILRISVAQKGRLAAAIDSGETFRVTFDGLGDQIGSIRPGAVLTGFYTKSREAWEVWSPSHPARPDYHYIYALNGPPFGRLDAPVHPSDGKINLWGATFPFDDNGVVYHPSDPKKAIGRLELVP